MESADRLRTVLYLVLALLCASLAACARLGPAPVERGAEARDADRAIHVVGHGWHTGLVIARADIPEGLWPESADFPTAEYLEVGWGDRDFYMATENTWWLALKAAFWSTASVLHVAGFRGSVMAHFPESEIVELRLARQDLERLVRYIHDSHAREGAAAVAPLGPGLYGDSRFYPSRERFHLFNTCNVWTARGLRAAQFPVRAQLALTASALLDQARQFGRCLRCSGRSDRGGSQATFAPDPARLFAPSVSAEYVARPAQAAPLRRGTAPR